MVLLQLVAQDTVLTQQQLPVTGGACGGGMMGDHTPRILNWDHREFPREFPAFSYSWIFLTFREIFRDILGI